MKLSNLPANIVLSRRNGEGLRPWREWLRTLWRVMLPVAGHAEPAKAKNPATAATVQGTRVLSFLQAFSIILLCFKKIYVTRTTQIFSDAFSSSSEGRCCGSSAISKLENVERPQVPFLPIKICCKSTRPHDHLSALMGLYLWAGPSSVPISGAVQPLVPRY